MGAVAPPLLSPRPRPPSSSRAPRPSPSRPTTSPSPSSTRRGRRAAQETLAPTPEQAKAATKRSTRDWPRRARSSLPGGRRPRSLSPIWASARGRGVAVRVEDATRAWTRSCDLFSGGRQRASASLELTADSCGRRTRSRRQVRGAHRHVHGRADKKVDGVNVWASFAAYPWVTGIGGARGESAVRATREGIRRARAATLVTGNFSPCRNGRCGAGSARTTTSGSSKPSGCPTTANG